VVERGMSLSSVEQASNTVNLMDSASVEKTQSNLFELVNHAPITALAFRTLKMLNIQMYAPGKRKQSPTSKTASTKTPRNDNGAVVVEALQPEGGQSNKRFDAVESEWQRKTFGDLLRIREEMHEHRIEETPPSSQISTYGGFEVKATELAKAQSKHLQGGDPHFYTVDEKGGNRVSNEVSMGEFLTTPNSSSVLALSRNEALKQGMLGTVPNTLDSSPIQAPSQCIVPQELEERDSDTEEQKQEKRNKLGRLDMEYATKQLVYEATELRQKNKTDLDIENIVLRIRKRLLYGQKLPQELLVPLVYMIPGLKERLYKEFRIQLTGEDEKKYNDDLKAQELHNSNSKQMGESVAYAAESVLFNFENRIAEIERGGSEHPNKGDLPLFKELAEKLRKDVDQNKANILNETEASGDGLYSRFAKPTIATEAKGGIEGKETAKEILDALADYDAGTESVFQPRRVKVSERGRKNPIAEEINKLVDEWEKDLYKIPSKRAETMQRYNSLIGSYIQDEKIKLETQTEEVQNLESALRIHKEQTHQLHSVLEKLKRLKEELSEYNDITVGRLEELKDELTSAYDRKTSGDYDMTSSEGEFVEEEIKRTKQLYAEYNDRCKRRHELNTEICNMDEEAKHRLVNVGHSERLILEIQSKSRYSRTKQRNRNQEGRTQKANETKVQKQTALTEKVNDIQRRHPSNPTFDNTRAEQLAKFEIGAALVRGSFDDAKDRFKAVKQKNDIADKQFEVEQAEARDKLNKLEKLHIKQRDSLDPLLKQAIELEQSTGTVVAKSDAISKLEQLKNAIENSTDEYNSYISSHSSFDMQEESYKKEKAEFDTLFKNLKYKNTEIVTTLAERNKWKEAKKAYIAAQTMVQSSKNHPDTEEFRRNLDLLTQTYTTLFSSEPDDTDLDFLNGGVLAPEKWHDEAKYDDIKSTMKPLKIKEKSLETMRKQIDDASFARASAQISTASAAYEESITALRAATRTTTEPEDGDDQQLAQQFVSIKQSIRSLKEKYNQEIVTLKYFYDTKRSKTLDDDDFMSRFGVSPMPTNTKNSKEIDQERRKLIHAAKECAKKGVLKIDEVADLVKFIYENPTSQAANQFSDSIAMSIQSFEYFDPSTNFMNVDDFDQAIRFYARPSGRVAASTVPREYSEVEVDNTLPTLILSNALSEISELANVGGNRAQAYLRLICEQLVRLFPELQKTIETVDIYGNELGTQNIECADFTMWTSLKQKETSTYNYIWRVVRMWNKLPMHMRGGSWPSEEEKEQACSTEACLNGKLPKLDKDTGEVVVYTSVDVKRNEAIADLDDVTPIAWVSLTRNGTEFNVPVNDHGRVFRQGLYEGDEDDRKGFRLWQTQTEFFQQFMLTENEHAERAEANAIRRCVEAAKYPTTNVTYYEDFEVDDMDIAIRTASLNEKRRNYKLNANIIAIEEALRIARDEEEEHRENITTESVKSIYAASFHQHFFSLEDYASQSMNISDLDLQKLLIATNGSSIAPKDLAVLNQFEQRRKELESALFKLNVQLEHIDGIPRPWNELMSVSSEAYVRASNMNNVNSTHSALILSVAAPESFPIGDEKDGLKDTSWLEDDGKRIVAKSAIDKFIKSYYGWLEPLEDNHIETIKKYLKWMRDLRQGCFAYVIFMNSNIRLRTATCLYSASFVRDIIDLGPPPQSMMPAPARWSNNKMVKYADVETSTSSLTERNFTLHKQEIQAVAKKITSNREGKKKVTIEPESVDLEGIYETTIRMQVARERLAESSSLAMDRLRSAHETQYNLALTAAATASGASSSTDVRMLLAAQKHKEDLKVLAEQAAIQLSGNRLDNLYDGDEQQWFDLSQVHVEARRKEFVDAFDDKFKGYLQEVTAKNIPLILNELVKKQPGRWGSYLKVVEDGNGNKTNVATIADLYRPQNTITLNDVAVQQFNKLQTSFRDLVEEKEEEEEEEEKEEEDSQSECDDSCEDSMQEEEEEEEEEEEYSESECEDSCEDSMQEGDDAFMHRRGSYDEISLLSTVKMFDPGDIKSPINAHGFPILPISLPCAMKGYTSAKRLGFSKFSGDA
jgi:hypothetical protein